MSSVGSVPLPMEQPLAAEAEEKRLWIGNIDVRLTEYDLLKILQKCGEIKQFDFLFHKTGALKGFPRGYSFVTYATKEQAEKALTHLNGRLVLGKNLAVKWANSMPKQSLSAKKTIKALEGMSSDETKQARNALHQILAIEAKLKAMDEQKEKELELCLTPSTTSASKPPLLPSTSKRTSPYSRPFKKHRM